MEASRDHDVYLFPTRYLRHHVVALYELGRLVGCVWGCLYEVTYTHGTE